MPDTNAGQTTATRTSETGTASATRKDETGTGETGTSGYHAHVYFDPATRPIAERLREAIVGQFAVEPGGFSDEPRGPHPISQFNVIFKSDEFARIVPWLMLNREGLDVLVHPLTEDMVDDHTDFALWLGTPVALKIDTLKRRGYGAALLPTAPAQTAAAEPASAQTASA